MKKLLVLCILSVLLFSCSSLYYKEGQDIFIVVSIRDGWNNYKVEVELCRLPKMNNEIDTIYLLTNDYTIKLGDRFMLKKIKGEDE